MSEQKENAVRRHYTEVKVLEKKVSISFFERIETEEDYIKNNYSCECQHAVHEDFRNKLDNLKGHLVRICEQYETDDYEKVPASFLEKIKMNGFSISGSDETEGVILTGMRKIKSGQYYNLVTPLMRFENMESYDQIGELYHDIKEVQKEADAYLKGKYGPGTQWSLSFDSKMAEDIQDEPPVDLPEPKKKGSKKKDKQPVG